MKINNLPFYMAIVTAFLMGNDAFAQNALKADVLQNVVPSSPTAASLGKFGETPVGLYNGIPEIGVPIHTISAGPIKIPISVAYHAGGIKVEEIASPVGLGWSLSAGGAITRQLRGRADESAGGYLSLLNTITSYLYAYLSPNDESILKSEIANGNADTEADIFYYNFAGNSGKFHFDENGNIVSFPKNTVRFLMTGNGWEVTDNAGVKYFFTEAETTQTTSTTGQLSSIYSNLPTAWFLSSIRMPGTNHQITFEYENYYSSFATLAPQTKYVLNSPATWCETMPQQGLGDYLQNYISGKRLKRIVSPNETVDFVYSALLRLDQETDKALEKITIRNHDNTLTKDVIFSFSGLSSQQPGLQGMNMYNNRLFLASLEIKDATGRNGGKYTFDYNSGSLPSRLSCDQDIWGYYNSSSNGNNLVPTTTLYSSLGYAIGVQGADRYVRETPSQYGILQKITYPTGGSTTFDYEGNDVSTYTYIPSSPQQGYVSVGTDLLGGSYFESPVFKVQAMPNSDPNAEQLVQINISNGGCGGGYASLECPMFTIVGVSHSYYAPMNYSGQVSLPVGEYKLVMDLSFVDPFGPYYSISYGEVYFQVPPQPSVYGTFELKAGGLRIKSIKNWDFNGSLISQKRYEYKDPITGISSGRISQLPEYKTDFKYLRSSQASWGTTYHFECNYIGISSSTNYPLSNTKGGAVGYKYVRETYDQSGEGGMTEYYFTSPESNPDILQAGFPFPPVKDYDWQRGHLLKEIKWKASGTAPNLSFQKVSEKQIEYTSLYESYSGSIKHGQRIFNQRPSAIYDPPGAWFELTGYSSSSGIFVPAQEKYIEYSSNGQVYEELKAFTYNPTNYLPVSVTSTNSKGQVITTEMKYPHHFPGQSFVNALNNENKVNEVVEQKTLNQSSQISRTVKEFSVFSGAEGSYAEISKIKSADKFGTLDDELTVIQRDANRNVIEAKGRDGVIVTLLYGYNRSLPVAKIVGVPYAIVQSSINESAIQSLDGSDLRSYLSSLRNISGAQVTIYTYRKGVGLSSETDPRGRTTFYDYDSFGRLLQVRDHENNILKRYCYNYAGDPVNCN